MKELHQALQGLRTAIQEHAEAAIARLRAREALEEALARAMVAGEVQGRNEEERKAKARTLLADHYKAVMEAEEALIPPGVGAGSGFLRETSLSRTKGDRGERPSIGFRQTGGSGRGMCRSTVKGGGPGKGAPGPFCPGTSRVVREGGELQRARMGFLTRVVFQESHSPAKSDTL